MKKKSYKKSYTPQEVELINKFFEFLELNDFVFHYPFFDIRLSINSKLNFYVPQECENPSDKGKEGK